MKRESLKKKYGEYCRHWNVIQCIGDHPHTVELREEREKRLQRVKKLLDLTDDYESSKEFLDDVELLTKIITEAMTDEKFI